MERLSIFDIFKIGVGPSSSHTLGPWKAALQFRALLQNQSIDKLEVHLFGSLSKTGRGHATDIAVQLGLEGFAPKTIDTENIDFYIAKIKSEERITLASESISFVPSKDIIFQPYRLPGHPNAVTFKAWRGDTVLLERTYYSVGGGFIQEEGVDEKEVQQVVLPYPIDKGADLLAYAEKENLEFWDIVQQNELAFRSQEDISAGINDIFDTMLACAYKGCHTGGILPGGLNVKRRAKNLNDRQFGNQDFKSMESWLDTIKATPNTFENINNWISCFALAVNEENAALGRVVTSPTNGAAGVIPAVLLYHYCFGNYTGQIDLEKFFYTAGEIGCLFKKGATISAAMGGCQAEIGVSSAMAAGGLTAVKGGSTKQVLMAAEIAMEHHLGLTCDPVHGLVQIPCIERNTMGAMKAITASNLALASDPDDAIVHFDLVVKTMWETAQDMNEKYRETAEGGLAFNLPILMPNC